VTPTSSGETSLLPPILPCLTEKQNLAILELLSRIEKKPLQQSIDKSSPTCKLPSSEESHDTLVDQVAIENTNSVQHNNCEVKFKENSLMSDTNLSTSRSSPRANIPAAQPPSYPSLPFTYRRSMPFSDLSFRISPPQKQQFFAPLTSKPCRPSYRPQVCPMPFTSTIPILPIYRQQLLQRNPSMQSNQCFS
jgi:hypothetical protein